MPDATTANGAADLAARLARRLSPRHLADLRGSGLSDETINSCRYRTARLSSTVQRILRWTNYNGELGECLAFPFDDADPPAGYARLKPDHPRLDNNGKPIKYESPKGLPNRAYFPPGTRAVINDPAVPLLITEGEKKSAKANQEGFKCVGLVGIWGWHKKRERDDNGNAQGERELIPDLAAIAWQGRHVFIVFDGDAATNRHVRAAAWHLAQTLARHGAIVKVVRLPGADPGSNGEAGKVGLDDFLIAHGADALRELLVEAVDPAPPDEAPAFAEFADPEPWPEPPAEEAFHGLAGRIVRVIEPASEADPVALLGQLLVAFGNVVGRLPRFLADGKWHRGNENIVLVGRSSRARKGTSWGHIHQLFGEIEVSWAAAHILDGLSSGEGLIWAVRDAIFKRERIKESGGAVRYEEIESDPGVTDKRLLVCEAEFANVLKQAERAGNTLTIVLRKTWDGDNLNLMTKNSPAKATGPHVSLIGHITEDELRRHLSATEMANGFGNRHLWLSVQRSKFLPSGGTVDAIAWNRLRGELAQVVEFARSTGEVRRDDDARRDWEEIYRELTADKPGLVGAMLARAEAHVARLSMLYALLDHSAVIKAEHLAAAVAFWEYSERSVRHIFGDSLGDDVADEILRQLRACPAGMTRTQIMGSFGRNVRSERIGRALGLLLQHHLVRFEHEDTGGRPAERWFAVSR
jgi:hypothetical protein